MKNNRTIATLKAIAAMIGVGILCHSALGQTVTVTNPAPAMPSFSSGVQEIYDAFGSSTNYGVVVGGMRATTGNRNIVFADLVYNVSQNVGIVIGYDYLTGGPKQVNLVRGGVTLSAPIHILKQFGFTNVVMTPFASGLVATGGGSASTILAAGDKVDVYSFKGFDLGVGVIWEKRSNAGYYNGSYLGGFGCLSKGF
ncbi:MAG: hypothetical protein KGL39_46720 [Patescibacteria group bacterium]|nr:hypothetical protein [Patescibacteria group bacterium]